jgi:hypothetical protein
MRCLTDRIKNNDLNTFFILGAHGSSHLDGRESLFAFRAYVQPLSAIDLLEPARLDSLGFRVAAMDTVHPHLSLAGL